MTEFYIFPHLATERYYPEAHIAITDFGKGGISINPWGDPNDEETGTMILLTASEAQWLGERISEALDRSARGEEYVATLP